MVEQTAWVTMNKEDLPKLQQKGTSSFQVLVFKMPTLEECFIAINHYLSYYSKTLNGHYFFYIFV